MSEKSERLLQCMSDIREETVEDAVQYTPKKKSWKRWGAMAAALALVIGVGSYLMPRMGGSSGSTGAAGEGTQEATTFMSYAGPVFPLTLKEGNAAITAQRDIALDFAPWVPVWISNESRYEEAEAAGATPEELEEYRQDLNDWYPEGGYYTRSSDILVTDTYTLTNTSQEDQVIEVLYPFASSLNEYSKLVPRLEVDGTELETTLHVGAYSGGFQGAFGSEDQEEGSLNLEELNSWEEYKVLLSDGSYLEDALAGFTDVSDIPAVVYKFTDPWGTEEDSKNGVPNPSLRVSFNMDYEKTWVLSYGFHSGRFDSENHFMGRGFSIPQEGEYGYGRPYYLIVVGDDVENMTYQGHVTGGWDDDPTIEAGVTITRYETDLDTALREVIDLMYPELYNDRNDPDQMAVEFDTWYGAFCDFLFAYGPLSEQGAERYADGSLEMLEAEGVARVLYLEAEITVPAGKSLNFTAAMTKEPSYDYHCAHTENRGVYGYDVVTRLGSNLNCTKQTATLEDRGQVEIIRQNFGFDLAQGVRTVSLDPAAEHYYLEVKHLPMEEEGE